MRDASHYGDEGAQACPLRFWQAPVPYKPDVPTAGNPLLVYANEGRWIAGCPDCNSAQLASFGDRRFLCIGCANVGNGGAWRPLTWPKDRPAIEAVLDVRQPVHQNWAPGATVADLTAENAVNLVGS